MEHDAGGASQSEPPAAEEPPREEPAAEAGGPADSMDRVGRADAIVRRKVLWALGVGVVPLPIVDMLGVAGLQIAMLKDLSELYGVAFSNDAARKIVASLLS